MAIYGYTHSSLQNMEKFILEHDMQALILEQLATIHGMLCSANEHVQLAVGINKGRCKYCLRVLEVIKP